MLKKWIGDTFKQKSYILMAVRAAGLRPETDVIDILLMLDLVILGDDNYTAEDEDELTSKKNWST